MCPGLCSPELPQPLTLRRLRAGVLGPVGLLGIFPDLGSSWHGVGRSPLPVTEDPLSINKPEMALRRGPSSLNETLVGWLRPPQAPSADSPQLILDALFPPPPPRRLNLVSGERAPGAWREAQLCPIPLWVSP